MLETHFFHHFANFTYKELTESPGYQDLWLYHVLPIAQQNQALRLSIAAVGAAHYFFSDDASSSVNRPEAFKSGLVSLKLYNQAIGCIAKDKSLDTGTILLCCLLFICYESMAGRYSESIRHLKAGVRLLAGFQGGETIPQPHVRSKVFNLYAQISIEFSHLIESTLTPHQKARPWVPLPDTINYQIKPFSSLPEATNAARALDLEFFSVLSQDGEEDAYSDLMCGRPREPCPHPEAYDAVMMRIDLWIARSEQTIQAYAMTSMAESDLRMLARLRVQQATWSLVSKLHWDKENDTAIKNISEKLLHCAESMAQILVSCRRRIFSMDGDLISSLSLVISFSSDRQLQERACSLLESLNRREGAWDSREIAEMHRATLNQAQPSKWYAAKLPGGIPGYVRALSSYSKLINPQNGLLRYSAPTEH